MNPLLRLWAFTVSAIVFLGFVWLAGLTNSLADDAGRLIVYYLGISVAALALWAFFPDKLSNRQSAVVIFGLAVISRLLMSGFPVSDDVNRYLWEGKLLLEGESPYAMKAENPAWESYRDEYWEAMNHKDQLTAYPPLSLMVFAALNLIDYDTWIYKLFFGLMDLAALGMLLRILTHRKLQLRNSLIYALNPITILAFSGEAHFDSLFVFLMMASLAFAVEGKHQRAWLLLGLSIQIKLMSVLLIPLLFWRDKSARILWLIPPLLIPSLFFWQDLPNLITGILHFGGAMSHNGSINHLLIDWLGDRGMASKVSLVLLLFLVAVTSLKSKDLLKGAFIIFGGLILLAPTVHYWYLSWVLPFVVLFPSLPWLVLFTLAGFYFTAWVQFGKTGIWYQPIGYLRLQWLPFYILAAPLFLSGIKKLFRKKGSEKVESLSVVIPILNESGHLPGCLDSLSKAEHSFREIVIVDGGSQDHPQAQLEGYPVQFLQAEKGRGLQIAAGIQTCKTDVVLVLHADTQLAPETPSQILDVLNANPEVVGGAIGQRFSSAKPRPVLVLIEALNDFRAMWQGDSFGDQGQFFRMDALKTAGGFPEIPLMEDVELSMRMKSAGDLVLLDSSLTCSARRWDTEQALGRILQVLSLVLRYKVLRLFGKDPSGKLFQEYYSGKSE